jgi:hypothetical protein
VVAVSAENPRTKEKESMNKKTIPPESRQKLQQN